ncbi:MAG: hypothetical protein QXM69_08950 [Sulfolobaceae archaeon]
MKRAEFSFHVNRNLFFVFSYAKSSVHYKLMSKLREYERDEGYHKQDDEQRRLGEIHIARKENIIIELMRKEKRNISVKSLFVLI